MNRIKKTGWYAVEKMDMVAADLYHTERML